MFSGRAVYVLTPLQLALFQSHTEAFHFFIAVAFLQAHGAASTLDLSGTWTICWTGQAITLGTETLTVCNVCDPNVTQCACDPSNNGCFLSYSIPVDFSGRGCFTRGPMNVVVTPKIWTTMKLQYNTNPAMTSVTPVCMYADLIPYPSTRTTPTAVWS
jgi:hypothetical protein